MPSINDLLRGSAVHQRVTARLRLPGYAGAVSFIPGLESYSVHKLEGSSALTQSYSFIVRFASDRSIAVEELVDTEAELILKDEQRPLISKTVHGRIYAAKEHGSVARKHLYEIELVSPLHYLCLNQRYEIYMDKSVPEIVQEVIGRYDALLHLRVDARTDAARFPKRHYTTQYEQSDFDFITMLCEEEGLVLLLDAASNDPYTLTLCELNEHSPIVREGIECRYNLRKQFSASAEVQDYYDPLKPSVDMQVQSGTSMSAGVMEDNASTVQLRSEIRRYRLRDRLETFEGSRYKDLNRYTALNAQRDFASGMRITGECETLTMQEGITVTLEDEKAGKSIDAIILKATYKGSFPNALDEYLDDEENEEVQYTVTFEAIPKELIYRPEPTVTKPRIESIVTAIVSGGDPKTPDHAKEIDVNEQGEIRVIFHFDEKRPTSCYVPLSTLYAGDGYGAQFLPRINSEVIVSFIGGDPDRPVITGALHNGENRHPYNLPKEKTQSFIKTQTTPQYADEEGYNELRFEDRQGEELLSLRAQKDYSLHTLNDASTHIQHDAKTVIAHDMEHTVQNDRTETVGNDYRLNVTANQITTVEKEQLTTVKEDRETHLLQDDTTIVNRNRKTIIEQNLVERIKGEATRYVEQDQKEKYLSNLFAAIGQDLGIQVDGAYHLTADSIKHEAGSVIEYEAPGGISLKCGGNVITVDASGIHLKAAVVDTNSGNGGVAAADAVPPEIEKPLYNKLRVTALEASVTKQGDISEVLTYTAKVEKYENGAWAETTDLTPTQEAQLQWYFIKNNDAGDKDILTDNPTDDSIGIEGLTMTVNVDPENIHRFGHAHCFVADSDSENGHALTELKRNLEVIEITESYISDEEGDCIAILNVDEATEEELAKIRWNINDRDVAEYNGKENITHNLKEENSYEIYFKAYIDGRAEDAAVAVLIYDINESGEVELKTETKEA